MITINELTEIMRALNGAASLSTITEAYCQGHGMLTSLGCRKKIEGTLKELSNGVIVYDAETGLWKLIPEKLNPHVESSTASQEPAQIAERGNFLELEGVLEGSPEWFYQQSKIRAYQEELTKLAVLRKDFIEAYSPEKLGGMSGEELLVSVFSDYDRKGDKKSDSMLYKLTTSKEYNAFGASGKYVYLWPIRYFPEDDTAVIYEKSKPKPASHVEAVHYAENIRDDIERCLDAIKVHEPFETIEDYKAFDADISEIQFSRYPWALKYYQMLYPEYFPGMYGDQTLNRTIKVLGLPKRGKRIQKMGAISLFTRECNIDNVTFMYLFGDRWGWGGDQPMCQYAVSKAGKPEASQETATEEEPNDIE